MRGKDSGKDKGKILTKTNSERVGTGHQSFSNKEKKFDRKQWVDKIKAEKQKSFTEQVGKKNNLTKLQNHLKSTKTTVDKLKGTTSGKLQQTAKATKTTVNLKAVNTLKSQLGKKSTIGKNREGFKKQEAVKTTRKAKGGKNNGTKVVPQQTAKNTSSKTIKTKSTLNKGVGALKSIGSKLKAMIKHKAVTRKPPTKGGR